MLPAVTSFDFPKNDLLVMGIALALLYLPLVLYRKAALAAAILQRGSRLMQLDRLLATLALGSRPG